MLNRIIQWSLENRLLVIVGAAILLVYGGIVALRTPIDVFPDLTAPTVTVLTEAHGRSRRGRGTDHRASRVRTERHIGSVPRPVEFGDWTVLGLRGV